MGHLMTTPTATNVRTIALIGYGAIGRSVAAALIAGQVPAAQLRAVVATHPVPEAPAPQLSLAEALDTCDLAVEVAGQSFVRENGVNVLTSGVDLLVASVGALADQQLADRLRVAGPGRIYYTSGAIGGLDLLMAARRRAPFDRVRLTTTKLPATLVQPWMSPEQVADMLAADHAIEVYRGTARDVPDRFPKSTNVAAGLALATGNWENIEVVVRADPAARLTSHIIEAHSDLGTYRFEISNTPDEDNPATSKVVPYAVLRSLSAITPVSGSIL